MVSLYAVWVPTLVAAHVVGFSLLLYSLEQVLTVLLIPSEEISLRG